MAAISVTIPVGWTEALVFQISTDDIVTDYTPFTTIALDVIDRNGKPVVLAGTVAWDDATTRKWKFTPTAGAFAKFIGQYLKVRFSVSDGTSLFYSPMGADRDLWKIVK